MSEEGNEKLFAHYKAVIGGSHKSSNSVSNELIVSDAKGNLADLVKKNPSLETTPKEIPEEPKSKGKK